MGANKLVRNICDEPALPASKEELNIPVPAHDTTVKIQRRILEAIIWVHLVKT